MNGPRGHWQDRLTLLVIRILQRIEDEDEHEWRYTCSTSFGDVDLYGDNLAEPDRVELIAEFRSTLYKLGVAQHCSYCCSLNEIGSDAIEAIEPALREFLHQAFGTQTSWVDQTCGGDTF